MTRVFIVVCVSHREFRSEDAIPVLERKITCVRYEYIYNGYI